MSVMVETKVLTPDMARAIHQKLMESTIIASQSEIIMVLSLSLQAIMQGHHVVSEAPAPETETVTNVRRKSAPMPWVPPEANQSEPPQ
jgi:hypothetical protein